MKHEKEMKKIRKKIWRLKKLHKDKRKKIKVENRKRNVSIKENGKQNDEIKLYHNIYSLSLPHSSPFLPRGSRQKVNVYIPSCGPQVNDPRRGVPTRRDKKVNNKIK